MNGVTIDGRKPIGGNVVHEYGHKGGAGESKPQASQIAAAGAVETGASGRKISPHESKPPLAGSAEVQSGTTGTTAEEQAKRLAGKMYPSSRGLARFGA